MIWIRVPGRRRIKLALSATSTVLGAKLLLHHQLPMPITTQRWVFCNAGERMRLVNGRLSDYGFRTGDEVEIRVYSRRIPERYPPHHPLHRKYTKTRSPLAPPLPRLVEEPDLEEIPGFLFSTSSFTK